MVLHSYCLSAFQFLSILKLVEGQCCLTSRDGQEFSLTSTAAAAVGLTSLLCRSLELAVFYHYTYGLLYQQPWQIVQCIYMKVYPLIITNRLFTAENFYFHGALEMLFPQMSHWVAFAESSFHSCCPRRSLAQFTWSEKHDSFTCKSADSARYTSGVFATQRANIIARVKPYNFTSNCIYSPE